VVTNVTAGERGSPPSVLRGSLSIATALLLSGKQVVGAYPCPLSGADLAAEERNEVAVAGGAREVHRIHDASGAAQGTPAGSRRDRRIQLDVLADRKRLHRHIVINGNRLYSRS
jgi:hypothetical protein